jgi:PKD repeat protein
VGHYLGLAHTFDNGCFGGDNCADTPPVANPNFGCPITTNSCSNDSPNLPDMIENYMDYADDNCMNAFTLDQKSIMQSVLTTANLRANLVSPTNATATGINVAQAPLCTPKADFRADARLACTNEPVQFSDLSWNGAPSQWSWSFPGATPSTSTDPNPVVTYAAPGDYTVTLTASNATGSNSVTKTQVITIRPSATPFVNQVVQDFETWPAPDLYWTSIDQSDGITFATTSTTGYNSSKSLRLNNHAVTTPGQVDEFITPTIELQWVTNATLTFNYAFARKTSSNTDQLRVLSSIDCGKTWILRRNVSTAQLETANQRPAPFTPNGAAEWKEISIPLFQLLSAPGPIMFKFEFTNGGGNNFYLDNINIASILSQSELATGIATAQIYPNPGAGSPTLVVPGWNEAYQVRVTDLGGRLCAPEQEFIGGAQQTLNLEHLSSGVYFITITANGQSHTLRYIRS